MNSAVQFLLSDGMMAVGALLLLSVGLMMRSKVLLWWSAGYGVAAIGLTIFVLGYERLPWTGFALAPALVLVTYGMMWHGLRSARAEAAQHPWVMGLGLGWIALSFLPPLQHNSPLRLAAFGPFGAAFMLAIAWEVRRTAGPPGPRILLALLAIIHAGFYVARSLAMLWVDDAGTRALWMNITSIEGIFFVFCDPFLAMSLVRSQRESALAREAYTDFLTGALTRRRFTERAGQALARGLGTIVIFDVDTFKSVNDQMGHAAGDALLQSLVSVCQENLGRAACIGRLGGDEFAVFVAGPSGEAEARALQIQQAFLRSCAANGWPSGLSFGLASNAGEDKTLEALLMRADHALYAAKAGRSQAASARDLSPPAELSPSGAPS